LVPPVVCESVENHYEISKESVAHGGSNYLKLLEVPDVCLEKNIVELAGGWEGVLAPYCPETAYCY